MRTLRLACTGWGYVLLVAALVTAQEAQKDGPGLTGEQWQELENQAAEKEKEAEKAETNEDFDNARMARQAVLKIRTRLCGERHCHVTDVRLNLEATRLREKLTPERTRQNVATMANWGQLDTISKIRELIPRTA